MWETAVPDKARTVCLECCQRGWGLHLLCRIVAMTAMPFLTVASPESVSWHLWWVGSVWAGLWCPAGFTVVIIAAFSTSGFIQVTFILLSSGQFGPSERSWCREFPYLGCLPTSHCKICKKEKEGSWQGGQAVPLFSHSCLWLPSSGPGRLMSTNWKSTWEQCSHQDWPWCTQYLVQTVPNIDSA